MSSVDTAGGTPAPTMRRVANSSLVGCILEWYDFYLYGFAAALVFAPLFFPNVSPLTATLASLGTFAVGFVARPLGGILCGHFGDRLGRKRMLVTTLLVMGIASFLIGVLPTYATIGVLAPVLLVVLRFVQGIGLGGEWGGAILMVVEHSPAENRGWWGSVIQLGAALGQALATGLLFGFSLLLTDEAFLSWGWRIPFLLSILLTAVGLFIRLRVDESPEFRAVRRTDGVVRLPVRDAIVSHWRGLLVCFGIYLGAITVPFFVQGVFLTSYGTATLGLNRTAVLLGVALIHATVYCLLCLLGGRLADRFGSRRVILVCLALLLVSPAAGMAAVSAGTVAALLAGVVIVSFPMWVAWGAVPAYFADSFPIQLRYTGVSLAGQASTIVGGLIPLFLTAVLAGMGGATWPVAATTAACALFGLVVTLALSRAPQRPPAGSRTASRALAPTAGE